MGLLSKTSAAEMQIKENLPPAVEPQIKKSNSLGLLKRSESILNNIHELDFFNFITKYKISSCALFHKSGDYYFIDNSIGFDGSSIITSFSSKSFWDGTISENNKLLAFCKKDNSISPFYQFLSEDLKEKTDIIYILKKAVLIDIGDIYTRNGKLSLLYGISSHNKRCNGRFSASAFSYDSRKRMLPDIY